MVPKEFKELGRSEKNCFAIPCGPRCSPQKLQLKGTQMDGDVKDLNRMKPWRLAGLNGATMVDSIAGSLLRSLSQLSAICSLWIMALERVRIWSPVPNVLPGCSIRKTDAPREANCLHYHEYLLHPAHNGTP